MTESKDTHLKKDSSPGTKSKQQEDKEELQSDDCETKKIEVFLPKPIDPIPSGKKTSFELQTNLPPEIALAILPHISDEQRKMLINELGKENERQFEAFKIYSRFKDKKHLASIIFSILIIFVAIGLTIFFTLTGHTELLEKVIQIILTASGGGGLVILVLHKKGMIATKQS